MRASELFEPVVLTLSRKLTGDSGYGGEREVHRFLAESDVAHVRLKGNDHAANLEKLKSFEPDYVFLNYPWQRNYPPAFRPDNLVRFTKIAYIPYFFLPLVNEEFPEHRPLPAASIVEKNEPKKIAGHLFEQRVHQLASLIFVQDNQSKDAFKGTSRGDSHVFVTGSPKLDVMKVSAEKFAQKRAKKIAKKRAQSKYDLRVLWAPHHSYSPAWLNFGRFAADHGEMLEFATSHPRIKLTLRPHPFLFGTLVDRGVLSESQLESWLEAWNALPNTRISSTKSFLKQFTNNDLLLTDGISFLAEYPLLMSKPAIFIENPGHWSFNEVGNLAAACNLRISRVSEFAGIAETCMSDGFDAAVGGAAKRADFASALARLRQVVDPNPSSTAKRIIDITVADFETSSPLVSADLISELAWEDRPGRELRDD